MALFAQTTKASTLQEQLSTTAQKLTDNAAGQEALAISLSEQATAASRASLTARSQAEAVTKALGILSDAGVTV